MLHWMGWVSKRPPRAGLDLSGNASAQMKSSGNTVIKGAIVMIN
jgi:hypothetical protein